MVEGDDDFASISQEVAVGSIAHVIKTTFEGILDDIQELPEAYSRLEIPPPANARKLTAQEVSATC
jgi:hypothetical protein